MHSTLVVQLTDVHLSASKGSCLGNVDTDQSLHAVLDLVAQDSRNLGKQPDLILMTGDLSHDGSPASYDRLRQAVERLGCPLAVLPGNHDLHDTFRLAWQGCMGPWLDIGDWRIVLLDSVVPGSDAGYLAPSQLALLKHAAKQAQGRHVLVALHHNPVTDKTVGEDELMLSNATALLSLGLALPDVKAMLWGHVHRPYDAWLTLEKGEPIIVEHGRGCVNSTDYVPESIRLLASPSTCLQFHADATPGEERPGYRLLQLMDNGSVRTIVRRPGDAPIGDWLV